ncbi:CopG family transcriptional regulator (plasmid) [Rhodococcus oxybenzonivorans]|uniref:CopG family transcriptional regulator n=1 Tax=Rhodococcus oxybenzonivorans TaxID=1990687 RepID=A0A2S2C7S4_9NOCA|nr:CopG family transcriptional regulator [Rhodococcus oxybenzonivorans]AWK76892.1 CopG family transcriptional regulator [Rhodococcus oxybenzonivorans]
MTESRPGRIPVGDPIALRFDPETKHRLDEMAEGIGPRRFGALIRVACRRLVTQPKAVRNRLEEARRLSAVRRAIPLVMLTLKLEPDTAQKFTALAAQYDTTISALMRIALHRFLETPGRYKHPMLREAERTGLSDKVEVMVNPSAKQQVWRLAGRHGTSLGTALLRVALRRLLDKPGDLSADLEAIAPLRDLRPDIFSARVNVHFDAPLRDKLDALAAQVGSDRAELMRLAAQRVLEAPGMIEQAVNHEIFRSEKNRAHLMARHVRRRARRRTQPD